MTLLQTLLSHLKHSLYKPELVGYRGLGAYYDIATRRRSHKYSCHYEVTLLSKDRCNGCDSKAADLLKSTCSACRSFKSFDAAEYKCSYSLNQSLQLV